MSYCRRSADCEVYVYEGCGGYIHLDLDGYERYYKTAKGCSKALRQMSAEGVKVPQSVIDELEGETIFNEIGRIITRIKAKHFDEVA